LILGHSIFNIEGGMLCREEMAPDHPVEDAVEDAVGVAVQEEGQGRDRAGVWEAVRAQVPARGVTAYVPPAGQRPRIR